MSNDGRNARTRFRCTRPFMSRGHDRVLNPVRGIGILVLLVLCGGTTHLPGRVIPALQGPLGPEGMGSPTGSQDHLRPEEAVKGTELLLEEAVRGISARRLPSRREDSLLPGLLTDPAGTMPRQVNVSMAETAGSSTIGARGILPHPLPRGLAIGPLGTSQCTLDTATTGCMASAQLSRASTCIRSHHQVRSPSRLVLLLVRLLRMRRGIPLDRPRLVLPIGRRGVSTAPLKD